MVHWARGWVQSNTLPVEVFKARDICSDGGCFCTIFHSNMPVIPTTVNALNVLKNCMYYFGDETRFNATWIWKGRNYSDFSSFTSRSHHPAVTCDPISFLRGLSRFHTNQRNLIFMLKCLILLIVSLTSRLFSDLSSCWQSPRHSLESSVFKKSTWIFVSLSGVSPSLPPVRTIILFRKA